MSPDLADLLMLPAHVRLGIAQALWESVAGEDEDVELSDEHRAILENRLSDYQSGRVQAVSHEELMKRLSNRSRQDSHGS